MFALGAWAAHARESRSARGWLALFAAWAILRAVIFHGPGPVMCAVTALLCYRAASGGQLATVLGARPLAAIGKVSYSVYLLHAVAGGMALTWVREAGAPGVSRDAWAMSAALAASLATAWIMYVLVEKPAIRWSRRLARSA